MGIYPTVMCLVLYLFKGRLYLMVVLLRKNIGKSLKNENITTLHNRENTYKQKQ